jgi:hypothetical protein
MKINNNPRRLNKPSHKNNGWYQRPFICIYGKNLLKKSIIPADVTAGPYNS